MEGTPPHEEGQQPEVARKGGTVFRLLVISYACVEE